MSLVTPATRDLSENIVAQISAAVDQSIPLLPKAFIRVLANTLAGFMIILYKYAGFIFLQMFVKFATIEEVTVGTRTFRPLVEWGRLIDVGDPKPPVQATFTIDIVVENETGSLDAGVQLIGENNGVTYVLVGSVLLDASVVSGTVRAAFDQSGGNGAGEIGNLEVGDTLNFANPLANVSRATSITAVAVVGEDQEDAEIYRTRVVERFLLRPQGGALVDYQQWGEGVSGVRRVYPYTGAIPGEVDLYVEGDPLTSPPDGIPSQDLLDQVEAAVELDDAGLNSRRPLGTLVNVLPITRIGFDVEVTDMLVDDPASAQADIQTAVDEFFLERQPFVSGLTLPPRRDRIERSALIGLVHSLISTANGTFTTVEFELTSGGGPIPSYELGQGETAKLSSPVTFTP